MPLIAKTPQYVSHRRVPGTIGVPYADLRPSSAENQAIGRIGELLRVRVEEMQQERDVAVVGDIYTKWADAERLAKEELFKRTGKDAVNLDQEYDKFFTKSMGQADAETENGTQQREINRMLAADRQTSLDQLARHQVGEAREYQKQGIDGVFQTAATKAVAAGFDLQEVQKQVERVAIYTAAATRSMHPDAQEALLNSQRSKIYYASMKQQIALGENNSVLLGQAMANLEEWKEPLGELYSKLRSEISGEADLAQLDTAYNALAVRYGQNYEGAISEINNPDSAIMKSLGFDQRSTLNTRFKGLYNQRESQEAEREEERTRVLVDNDFEVWTRFYNGTLPSTSKPGNPSLDELASKRLITESTYRSIKELKRGAVKNNNPYVVGPIAEKLALGGDIREDLNKAAANGDIKSETFITMSGTNADKQKAEGMGLLVRALKPRPADKYNPDLHLAYADAIDLYNIRVRELPEGTTPIDIARDIVGAKADDVARTMSGLLRPRYFEGQQYTLETLSEAQKRTIDAYYDGQILEGEYSFQIRLIEQYIRYIKRTGQITPAIRKQIDSRKTR